MARHLAMDKVQAIQQLHARNWSQRQIAEVLGVDRKAVRRHIEEMASKGTKAPTGEAPTGDDDADGSKGTKAPTGSEGSTTSSQVAAEPGGIPVGRSDCEPLRQPILDLLEKGLSAQRIFQDLVADHGFEGSYYSVRRFVSRLCARSPLPFRRMEVEPGEEAQIDFGVGIPYLDANGKRRRCYVLRVVLSHSRKGYTEAVPRQTTDNFLRVLENAFHHFGGVPKTLVIDNLKAAVTKADWFDPELNPKVVSFAQHHGTVFLPTKPYTPRHKGKVESGIRYVKENGLKGRRDFESLAAENEALLTWETHVADTRIHGTTKKHVGQQFDKIERPALLPLPVEPFPSFEEGRRKVHGDGHIEVARAYYSMPPEYLGREVWVRWDARTVRVFNHRHEEITFHARMEPGKYSTHRGHLASEKISGVERGAAYLLEKIAAIGPRSARWAETMLAHRGVQGVRVLQGLLGLSRKYTSNQLEEACELAWRQQAYQLQVIRQLAQRPESRQEVMEFLDEHPLIRPLSNYDEYVHEVIQGGLSNDK